MWNAISVYIDNSVVFPGKLTKTSLFSNLRKHLESSCYSTCYVVVWVFGSMSGGMCGWVGIAVLCTWLLFFSSCQQSHGDGYYSRARNAGNDSTELN